MVNELTESIMDGIINDILNLISFDVHGNLQPVSDIEKVNYVTLVRLLYTILLDDTTISSRLHRAKILLNKEMGGLFGWELLPIFEILKKGGKTSFQDFKSVCEERINKSEETSEREYTLVYPLNAKFLKTLNVKKDQSSSRNPFNFEFRIISFEEFSSDFIDLNAAIPEEKDEIIKTSLEKVRDVCNENFSFFVISKSARNLSYADDYCTKKLLGIVGLLIYVTEFGQQYFHPLSPMRMSEITPNYTLYFENGKFITSGVFNILLPLERIRDAIENNISDDTAKAIDCEFFHKFALPVVNISNEHINPLFNLLVYGRKIKNRTIAEITFDAFKSYCEASIDAELKSSYLKYWICIEKCLLKEQKIAGTEIISIIKKMPILKDPRLKFQVNRLLDHRNIYVHKLDENITQIDRNLVKSISEGLLNFLLYNAQRFNSKQELVMFYTFIQKDNQNLITMQKSLANQNKIINLTMNIREFYEKLP